MERNQPLSITHPEVAAQWHPTKNGDLTPNDVTAGIRKKVWWKCAIADDHVWEASLSGRTIRRAGCPVCRGLKVVESSSLMTTHPELAKQWHPTKNGELKPDHVVAGSNKPAWWKCEKGPDHEWEAIIVSRKKGAGCPCCAGHQASITNCIATQNPTLAKQWHLTRNGTTTPYDVAIGSSLKYWWKCAEGPDHEWEASPDARKVRGCPFCAGKRISISTSLAVKHPDLAKEWHPTKNGNITPKDVTTGESTKYWWICHKGPDHEWESTIRNRVKGSGCPCCSGYKASVTNSLAALYPQVAAQWHPSKNGSLQPKDIVATSKKPHWWICHKGPDHEWKTTPQSRVRSGPGCPFCNGFRVSVTNALSIKRPDLVREWHPTKNKNKKPTDVVAGSKINVWWKCDKGPDHEWEATPYTRIKGHGCPFCAGIKVSVTNSLASLYPKIAEQWDYEKNGNITPQMITKATTREFWWKCPENSDHSWKASVANRTRGGQNCSYCNQGWTIGNIRFFVKSLQPHLHIFTDAELYLFFQQSGILTSNSKAKAFAKALSTGRIPPEEVDKFVKGEPSVADQFIADPTTTIDAALQKAAADSTASEADDLTAEDDVEKTEIDEAAAALEKEAGLPLTQTKDVLASLTNPILANADQEALAFLLASALAKLWKDAFENEANAVAQAEAFVGEGYAAQVRDRFLDEYRRVKELVIPAGYAFAENGRRLEPNLMQRLAAVRVRDQKRVGNWSGTGAGKTLSAVLASRVIAAELTVICCPNNVIDTWQEAIQSIFPDSLVSAKTFQDQASALNRPRYLVLNYEAFQQNDSPQKVKQLVQSQRLDFIVVDEIHFVKQRDEKLMSKRKQMVNAMITQAGEKNPDLRVLGMSATPVINNLQEARSLIEMIDSTVYDDLQTKATVSNCMRVHQKLVTLGLRHKPKYDIELDTRETEVDCTDFVPRLRMLGKKANVLALEQILTEIKLPIILQTLKAERKPTLIYTHYVDGIDKLLRDALENNGWRVGLFTGEDKTGLTAFKNGRVDVLIGSSAIGTGIDGLQKACDRVIMNCLPWTAAEYEQIIGRIYRQGQRERIVDVMIPIAYATVNNEKWSWCRSRLDRIKIKKTVADAAVDGIIPEGHLRTPEQAYKDLMSWLNRLAEKGEHVIERRRIIVPLPDTDPLEVKRRANRYGDFSQMNRLWNQTASAKTHERLQQNPEEWEQYHTLYREARKDWVDVPHEEMIRWCQKRQGLTVGDFGCGEALLAAAIKDRHTVHSFDHVAIHEGVTACDMSHVPLPDGSLDVAIFSLSLMGSNITDYIREAYRTLKLDGHLHIIEAASRFSDVQAFIDGLRRLGFGGVENRSTAKFSYLWARKYDAASHETVALHF